MISFIVFFIVAFSLWLAGYFGQEVFLLSDVAKASTIGTAMTSVSATMLGFMLAALSVLASISGLDFVQNLTKGNHYKDLLKNLFIGSFEILLLLIMSLILLFGKSFNEFFSNIYLSLLIASVVMLVEAGYKFWLILSNIGGK